MGKFRWTKKLFEFYRESLDWRNTNTPKYGKLRNAIIWFPRGCGTWNFQNILTTCCSKCIHNFKQFCYYNQHLVHGISHILSSCEPSSRKKRFRLSTSRLVACDNGADFPTVEDSNNLTSPHEPGQQNLFHILPGEESIMIFYNPTLAP